MKKIKEIFKNNLKIVIAFILGIIISGTTVYAATILYNANQVGFDNSNTSLQSTDVQGALDELYTRANKINVYENIQCPGCVYRNSTTRKYNSNSRLADGTNNTLTSSEYTTDYTTLNSNHFLGHVIDANGNILSSFVCGIEEGTLFCLRGVAADESSLTYKPFYQENINKLNKVFPGCNATISQVSVSCYGRSSAIRAIAAAEGYVYLGTTTPNHFCYVYSDGLSYC